MIKALLIVTVWSFAQSSAHPSNCILHHCRKCIFLHHE